MLGTRGKMSPALSTESGGQAVLVTTLLGDSVVGVHRLDREACGRVRTGTRAMLAVAAALLVGGLISVARSSLGSGAGLLLLGSALAVLAAIRAGRERRAPHFLVGEGRDAQLPLPGSLLPAPTYPLVLSTPRGYHLVFGSGMEGLVEENGVQVSLRDLVQSGQAWPAAGLPARAIALPRRGRASVRIGESTVVIDSVETGAPMRAALLGGIDSSGLLSSAFSFSAHAIVLLLVYALPPSGATLNLDSFNVDHVGVRYRIRAKEAMDRDRVPAWLRQSTAPQQPAGGPTARGDAGRVGNPAARPLRGRLAVRGNSQAYRPAAEWARELARDYGILGIMSRRQGGPFAHHLANESALGRDAEDAMGGLIGNIVGEDSGTGGLAPIGTGRGGGGLAIGLIPGGPGPRIANGRGPYGWGSRGAPDATLGPRRPTTIEPRGVVTVREGKLDKELIRREIKRHLNEIRYCYSKELQAKPELEGRVVVGFTIAPTGRVVSSQVQQSTLRDPQVESCITQAFFRWSFPKPPDQGMVIVSYPFVFHATE